MLREEEKNIEETSSENSDDLDDKTDEPKNSTPIARPANKSRSMRIQQNIPGAPNASEPSSAAQS